MGNIKPSGAARFLSRLAAGRLPRLSDARTMQMAIDDGGLVRVGAGVVARYLRLRFLSRLLPMAARTVFPPRATAVEPADGAVIRSPSKTDQAAAGLVESLRYTLPATVFRRLVGAAVVAADATDAQVLGYATGPAAKHLPRGRQLVARLCAGNPAGQDGERTPVLIAVRLAEQRRGQPDRDRAGEDEPGENRPGAGRSASRARATGVAKVVSP